MQKSTINSILKALPDDRPITSIQIIENLERCPRGFYPISKTYDQDQDADLRENTIFKISQPRYLCVSKTEGLPNFVVEEILVLSDKASPPKGFSLLNRTADSEQKAWKKKQICYRLVNKKDIKTAVTDIIICSRLKKAPLGFSFAGELNGITICYKMGNVQNAQGSPEDNGGNGNAAPSPPVRPPKPNPMYPNISGDGFHDYEILRPTGPVGPSRPAPRPPPSLPQNSNTISSSAHFGIEGVPFIVNPKFTPGSSNDKIPIIKARTMQQLMKDYHYGFTLERQT